MRTVAIKPTEKSEINKSVIGARKARHYTRAELIKRIQVKFLNPEILGKGKVLGDIVSPLYKEVDE